MNCPDVESYLKVVPPVVVRSTESSVTVGSVVQLIFYVLNVPTGLLFTVVDVISVEPANISNFSGTVCPLLSVFHTISLGAPGEIVTGLL